MWDNIDLYKIFSLCRMRKVFLCVFKSIAHLYGIYTSKDYVILGYRIEKETGLKRVLMQCRYAKLGSKLRIEIPTFRNIGENLSLVHASGIVIHEEAIIGKDCVIYKGVSIGSIRSGDRKGTPVIEDRVVIHANSVIAGGITIGHDSLIAANSFVDFDVPAHSVVIGSPGVIHKKLNASNDYLVPVAKE